MNILNKWLRPKWQHPEPNVRLKALADPAIDPADCHALAVSDPDPTVREHAINKLESIEKLLDVLRAQPTAQEAVSARLTALLLQAPVATIGSHLSPALAAIGKEINLAQLAVQATDPQIRVAAIEILPDQATLRRCALEDRAVEVRVHALERIDDEETLEEVGRAAKGRDKTVARLAAQRLSDLRKRRERITERAQLLDEFSRFAETPELDADTLLRARVRWQELEGDADAAQRDRYVALAAQLDARLAALRKIQQEDLSHKLEREKLLAQLRQLNAQLADADPKEARAALNILRNGWEQARPLQDGWTERRLQEEWQETVQQLESGLRQREAVVREEQAIAAAIAEFEATLQHGALQSKHIEAARQRASELSRRHAENPTFAKPMQRLRDLVDRMAAKLAQEQAEFKAVRRKLNELLAALESALQERQLDPATAAHREASRLLADAARYPELKPLQRRLKKCEPRFRELQSWRNWGSDKARDELIAEARQLVDADIGIEERAKALKSLRARWKALGGGTKAQRLWEGFDAACTAAHEPIKQYRREQAQQRERHLEIRAEICAKLERLAEATDWSSPDWRAVDRQLTEATRQWRAAGEVPHKRWKSIHERFDQAVAGIEVHLSKERRHNFLQRQALMREAQGLADCKDMRHSVAEARRLRDAWRVTAPSARKNEQALWKAFNAALDEVFKRDREVRDEFKAGLEERRQQAEALCLELEELTRADGAEVSTLRAELSRLAAAFDQLGELPRHARQGLERRFQQARGQLHERIAASERAVDRQMLVNYRTMHDICEQAEALAQQQTPNRESMDALTERWHAAVKPPVHQELLSALERRFASAMSVIAGAEPPVTQATLDGNAAVRGEICLELEILLKRESPPECQTERMQRQVALLAAVMQGADEPQERRTRDLQLDYLRQGPVAVDRQQKLAERFSRLFP